MAWNAYYKRLLPGRPPADLDEHRSHIRASMRRPGHARAFRKTTHSSHAPAEARLDDVRVPVLVVMGADDPDFPDPDAEARLIADRLDAEVLMVPESGHYPQAEYPEIVAPSILEFLRGSDLAGASD
jgi:pimeloyl-ACP methyl ester carboxylesterase